MEDPLTDTQPKISTQTKALHQTAHIQLTGPEAAISDWYGHQLLQISGCVVAIVCLSLHDSDHEGVVRIFVALSCEL